MISPSPESAVKNNNGNRLFLKHTSVGGGFTLSLAPVLGYDRACGLRKDEGYSRRTRESTPRSVRPRLSRRATSICTSYTTQRVTCSTRCTTRRAGERPAPASRLQGAMSAHAGMNGLRTETVSGVDKDPDSRARRIRATSRKPSRINLGRQARRRSDNEHTATTGAS